LILLAEAIVSLKCLASLQSFFLREMICLCFSTYILVRKFSPTYTSHLIFFRNADDIDGDTVAFWKRSVANWCIAKKSILFRHDDIIRDFTVNSLHPASYTILIDQLSDCILPTSSLKIDSDSDRNTGLFSTLSGFLFPPTSSVSKDFVCSTLLDSLEKILSEYAASRAEEDRAHFFDLVGDSSTLAPFLMGVGGAMSAGRAPAGIVWALVCRLGEGQGGVEELTLIIQYMIK
jgi:hypothetical protein